MAYDQDVKYKYETGGDQAVDKCSCYHKRYGLSGRTIPIVGYAESLFINRIVSRTPDRIPSAIHYIHKYHQSDDSFPENWKQHIELMFYFFAQAELESK